MKLYKADFSVIFVHDDELDEEQLGRKARIHMKDELENNSKPDELVEVKSKSDISNQWAKAIPWGDDSLTKGDKTCVDILEEILISKVAKI